MIKKLVTECSSDIYLLVNIPGLANGDMLDTKETGLAPFNQKYIHMASTVVGTSVGRGSRLTCNTWKYIVKTCKAEAVNVFYSEDEVAQYIDTRKTGRSCGYEPSTTKQGSGRRRSSRVMILSGRSLRKAPSPLYHYHSAERNVACASHTTNNVGRFTRNV